MAISTLNSNKNIAELFKDLSSDDERKKKVLSFIEKNKNILTEKKWMKLSSIVGKPDSFQT